MEDVLGAKLLGSSPQFHHVLAQLRRFAAFDVTVLIGGETGTGKELAARAVHYLSARAGMPFIPINCGALAESLVESELFGHERGAFTDAKNATSGLIAEADGGTLFLDEVDALPAKAQAALLRFLQDRTYRRVGGSQQRTANVRLVAASNADLGALAEARRFRRDLLYRLQVLTLTLPPLRERGNDAVELAHVFLARLNEQYRGQVSSKRFHTDALHVMAGHGWPGNVRELEHFVHREFLLCDGDEIRATAGQGTRRDAVGLATEGEFKDAKARAIEEFERGYVTRTLAMAQGNVSHAARMAGQDRSAFSKLVRKYGAKDKRDTDTVEH
ncbi:sigma 54-interacting transcriptional regulator [Xanthomonas sp. NCPPB 2632]|uniref:sigma 54-interacting transcriptional regulator n=1 Tax=Xanthomonas sp. NCPPB 2632 TaxID=3240912 RepID=UPI0035130DF7